MTSAPRPCIVCGVPSAASRCHAHRLKDTRPTLAKRVSRSVSKRLRSRVLFRDHYTCQVCGLLDRSGIALEADHIVRLADGGEHSEQNMQTLCKVCHLAKTQAESVTKRR